MCTHTTYPPPTVSVESFADCSKNSTNCHDHIGKEFFLMFLENIDTGYNDFDYLEVLITAEEDGVLIVQCPGIGLSVEKSISKGKQSVQIDKSARAKPLQNERKGIRVSSTVNISVYAMNMRQYESEGYTALPVDAIGTKYILATYLVSRKSQIGISAPHDGTVVTVHLNTTTPMLIDGVNRTRETGPFEIILNRYHTFEFKHSEDLSGTVLESNKDISVVAGNLCEMGSYSYKYECTHFCEQVPPVSSWGRYFIVPRISNVTGSFIRIVVVYGYTRINVTGKSVRKQFKLTDPNHRIDVDIGTDAVAVEASHPIYVLLVPKFTSNNFNSFMVSVPAIEQYGHFYHVVTPTKGFSSHYISIIINSKNNQLALTRLDNGHLSEHASDEQSVVVNGEAYTALTVAIAAKSHNITHLITGTNFGVLVYGFGTHEAYGYPGGMNLNIS